MSLTGRYYPQALLQDIGTTPEKFFANSFVTSGHDDALLAVADGLADGAFINSLVYAYSTSRDPSLVERTKIIHISPPLPIPPVVVNPKLSSALKLQLQQIFLQMVDDLQGQEVLKQLGVERFLTAEDSWYDSARAYLPSPIPTTVPIH